MQAQVLHVLVQLVVVELAETIPLDELPAPVYQLYLGLLQVLLKGVEVHL
jgi:hypothetical protein